MMMAHPDMSVEDASYLEFQQTYVVCLKPSEKSLPDRERFTESHGLAFLAGVPWAPIFNGFDGDNNILTAGDQRGIYTKEIMEGYYKMKGRNVPKRTKEGAREMVSFIQVCMHSLATFQISQIKCVTCFPIVDGSPSKGERSARQGSPCLGIFRKKCEDSC